MKLSNLQIDPMRCFGFPFRKFLPTQCSEFSEWGFRSLWGQNCIAIGENVGEMQSEKWFSSDSVCGSSSRQEITVPNPNLTSTASAHYGVVQSDSTIFIRAFAPSH